MAINKKLISFATQAQFDVKLNAGDIDNRSIVFIEDKKRIWTHGVFFDTSWDFVTGTPNTLAGYNITDAASKINSLYYVVGNTTGTAGAWTGTVSEVTSLYEGLTIAYKIGVAGASTTNLNLNGLGNKLVRRATGNLTTHLPVGTIVLLTYNGTNWVWADYDSNTTYAAMSVAEGTTGTATSSRTVRADYLKQIIEHHIANTVPSAHTLGSHSDVTITSNSAGEILKWNGTNWINNTLAEAGIASTGQLNNYLPLAGGTLTGALTIKSSANTGKDVLLTLGRSSAGYGDTQFSQSYDNRYYSNGKTLDIDLHNTTYLSLAGSNNTATGKIIAHKPIEYLTGTSDNWNTAYTYSQVGHLPLTGGTLTGDLEIFAGNTDKFIKFAYNTTDAYAWRIGYLGTGSGNENRLAFQSAKTSGTSYVDALSFGLDDLVGKFAVTPTVGNTKVSLEGHTHPNFTRTVAGLVPAPGAATTTRYLREDGTWVIPPNTPDTHWVTGVYVGAVTAKTDTTVTNPYIKIFDNDTNRGNVQIIGGTNVTVSSNSSKAITINSSYTDTTYTTGTLDQLNLGVDTTGRLHTAKILNDWLNGKNYATIGYVDNLEIGGRNYALKSGGIQTSSVALSIPDSLKGQKVTLSFRLKLVNTVGGAQNRVGFEGSNLNNLGVRNYYGAWHTLSGIPQNFNGIVKSSFTIDSDFTGNSLTLNNYRGFAVGDVVELSDVRLERGNKATYDWSPAPEDQVSDWLTTDVNSFSYIKNKPSTFTPSAHTHTFASLTFKPTTLSGYGITDAYTKAQVDTSLNGKVSKSGDTMSGSLTVPSINLSPRTVTTTTDGRVERIKMSAYRHTGQWIQEISDEGDSSFFELRYKVNNINTVAFRTSTNGVVTIPKSVTAPTFIGALSGNASSATKVNNKLILKFDTGTTENTNLYTYDGSAAKTIDIKAGSNVSLTKAANTITISSTNTNTTYSEITEAETVSTSSSAVRLITGRRLKYAFDNITAANATNATNANILNRRGDNRGGFKPSDITSGALITTFSTQGALLSQTNNSDYVDVIGLSTYQDSSAGQVNSLAFDKSSHRITHFMGTFGTSSWSSNKTLAYTDGTGASGTWGINITGNAATASAVTLTADNSTNATRYPLFVDAATGNKSPRTDTGFTYNPSTGALTSTSFVGSLSGNASSATTATNASKIYTSQKADNVNYQIPFVASVTAGNSDLYTDNAANFTYNPSTNAVSASSFNGITGLAGTGSASTASRSDHTHSNYVTDTDLATLLDLINGTIV